MSKVADLRHRISFQELGSTADGQGGFTAAWTTYRESWADITPKSGIERRFSEKLEDVYDHEVVVRNTLDQQFPKAKDRILFGTRVFQIKSVIIKDELKFFLILKVAEGEAS